MKKKVVLFTLIASFFVFTPIKAGKLFIKEKFCLYPNYEFPYKFPSPNGYLQTTPQWYHAATLDNGLECFVQENFDVNKKGNYVIQTKIVHPKNVGGNGDTCIYTYEVTSDLRYYRLLSEKDYNDLGKLIFDSGTYKNAEYSTLKNKKPTERKEYIDWMIREILSKNTKSQKEAHTGSNPSKTTNLSESIKNRTNKEENVEEDDEIYVIADNQPEFPGGNSALMEYLSNNIQYPEVSQKKGIQGRVMVRFVVNKDGSLSDPVVARSVDSYLDKEALRLVSSMPKWKPGTKNGKSVRVQYILPISFKLP